MAKMLGRKKRPRTCFYGCCREWHTPAPKKVTRRRSVKRGEKQKMRKEIANGEYH